VALTGGSGFIGAQLIDRLLAEGLTVRALWRSGQPPRHTRLEIVPGSLESDASLAELVRDCATVLHVAAAIRGRSQADFDAVNVAGTRRLAAAVASHAPAARCIAVSSLAAREPGLSWYAASKAAAEQLLLTDTITWTILRPPAVYGPGDQALAPLWRGLARGWLPGVGPSGARFSLLHVTDLCEAVLRLVSLPAPVAGILCLHDGRDGGYSWQDVAAIAAALRGAPVRVVPVPLGLLRVVAALNLRTAALRGTRPMLTPGKLRELAHPDWVCDNSRLAAALGWSPGIPLAAGLPGLPGWENLP